MKQNSIKYAMVFVLGVSQYLCAGTVEFAKNNHGEQIGAFLKYFKHGFNVPFYYREQDGYLVKQDDIVPQFSEKTGITIGKAKNHIHIFLGLLELPKIQIEDECYFKLGEHQYIGKLKILLK